MKQSLFLAFALLMSDVSFACSVGGLPISWLNNVKARIITSPNEQFFLKLIPSRWKTGFYYKNKKLVPSNRVRWKAKPSQAIAYELLADGQFKKLWSFENWDYEENSYRIRKPYTHYRFSFYLSNDGMNLVGISHVMWAKNKNAVVMFRKGVKVKRYSPEDFGIRKVKRKPPCPHSGSWIERGEPRRSSYGSPYVYIRTTNNQRWQINPDTLDFQKAK